MKAAVKGEACSCFPVGSKGFWVTAHTTHSCLLQAPLRLLASSLKEYSSLLFVLCRWWKVKQAVVYIYTTSAYLPIFLFVCDEQFFHCSVLTQFSGALTPLFVFSCIQQDWCYLETWYKHSRDNNCITACQTSETTHCTVAASPVHFCHLIFFISIGNRPSIECINTENGCGLD